MPLTCSERSIHPGSETISLSCTTKHCHTPECYCYRSSRTYRARGWMSTGPSPRKANAARPSPAPAASSRTVTGRATARSWKESTVGADADITA